MALRVLTRNVCREVRAGARELRGMAARKHEIARSSKAVRSSTTAPSPDSESVTGKERRGGREGGRGGGAQRITGGKKVGASEQAELGATGGNAAGHRA